MYPAILIFRPLAPMWAMKCSVDIGLFLIRLLRGVQSFRGIISCLLPSSFCGGVSFFRLTVHTSNSCGDPSSLIRTPQGLWALLTWPEGQSWGEGVLEPDTRLGCDRSKCGGQRREPGICVTIEVHLRQEVVFMMPDVFADSEVCAS